MPLTNGLRTKRALETFLVTWMPLRLKILSEGIEVHFQVDYSSNIAFGSFIVT